MRDDTREKFEEEKEASNLAQNRQACLPFVTVWQDESGAIQIKLGNGITPVNAVALLELGVFRYKATLLPSIAPRPVRSPEGSEPQ